MSSTFERGLSENGISPILASVKSGIIALEGGSKFDSFANKFRGGVHNFYGTPPQIVSQFDPLLRGGSIQEPRYNASMLWARLAHSAFSSSTRSACLVTARSRTLGT